ncbi:MAG: type II toxin-antitoxin system RelE/ParE family toxin [Campylobacterales bacterium]|nr:type II toxin-antitoxin system RelE/ParE family toxin [Campylobacterales bacterium]
MNLKIIVLDNFAKEVKKLAKRYKQIASDLKELEALLSEDARSGVHLGGRCYKIRLANSSIPTGKSGGFRVIYYYLDEQNNIYLMSIYAKSDLENISDEKIIEILEDNGLL